MQMFTLINHIVFLTVKEAESLVQVCEDYESLTQQGAHMNDVLSIRKHNEKTLQALTFINKVTFTAYETRYFSCLFNRKKLHTKCTIINLFCWR